MFNLPPKKRTQIARKVTDSFSFRDRPRVGVGVGGNGPLSFRTETVPRGGLGDGPPS